MAKRRKPFSGRNFTSGRLKLNVKYDDRRAGYQVKICPLVKGERCETVFVGEIPGGRMKGGPTSRHGKRISYEDPRATRSAASAAISHSNRDMATYADYNRRGSGYLIKPAVRRKRR